MPFVADVRGEPALGLRERKKQRTRALLMNAAIDLCNRPYFIWKVSFNRDKVGQVDTELFKEFFHAFAMNSGACAHIELLYGENSHHIAESCFKALARAVRAAATLDPRLKGQVASTKGSL